MTLELSACRLKPFFMPLKGVVSAPKSIWRGRKRMGEPAFSIEEVPNPHDIARARAQDEGHCRNSDWLQTYWADVLPQARGEFLAVAGQEPFIADTPEWCVRASTPRI
jgi:hypothetical protein